VRQAYEYYCSSNLPRLYWERNRKGDESRAQLVLSQVMMACERALERGASDEWLPPTLLTAAFDAADADKAEELAETIDLTGAAPYKLDLILDDLESSTAAVVDPERQMRLREVVARLRAYLAYPS
jgi:hypothetical protein